MTPAGYSFYHTARPHRGVGVDKLIYDYLKSEKHFHFQATSFENCQLTFMSIGVSARVAIVYWLDPAEKDIPKARDFFEEVSEFIDSLATSNAHLLILGDFNVYWDSQEDADTTCLSEILRPASLN